jgi:hypothetical protein
MHTRTLHTHVRDAQRARTLPLPRALQVPANRVGHVSSGGPFSAPVLKVIQELISLSAFAVFSTTVLREKLRWTDGLGFVLIIAGVAVAMAGREVAARREAAAGAGAGGMPPAEVTPQGGGAAALSPPPRGTRAYERLEDGTQMTQLPGGG